MNNYTLYGGTHRLLYDYPITITTITTTPSQSHSYKPIKKRMVVISLTTDYHPC